jgi:hypothetical protein
VWGGEQGCPPPRVEAGLVCVKWGGHCRRSASPRAPPLRGSARPVGSGRGSLGARCARGRGTLFRAARVVSPHRRVNEWPRGAQGTSPS